MVGSFQSRLFYTTSRRAGGVFKLEEQGDGNALSASWIGGVIVERIVAPFDPLPVVGECWMR
jgi:hypothetical protein